MELNPLIACMKSLKIDWTAFFARLLSPVIPDGFGKYHRLCMWYVLINFSCMALVFTLVHIYESNNCNEIISTHVTDQPVKSIIEFSKAQEFNQLFRNDTSQETFEIKLVSSLTCSCDPNDFLCSKIETVSPLHFPNQTDLTDVELRYFTMSNCTVIGSQYFQSFDGYSCELSLAINGKYSTNCGTELNPIINSSVIYLNEAIVELNVSKFILYYQYEFPGMHAINPCTNKRREYNVSNWVHDQTLINSNLLSAQNSGLYVETICPSRVAVFATSFNCSLLIMGAITYITSLIVGPSDEMKELFLSFSIRKKFARQDLLDPLNPTNPRDR